MIWRILAILALACCNADAQLLHGVTDALSGGGVQAPSACQGVINLSIGCAQPMLFGIP